MKTRYYVIIGIIIVIVVIGFVVAVHYGEKNLSQKRISALKGAVLPGFNQVLHDIYDDNSNSVYIKTDSRNVLIAEEKSMPADDQTICNLIAKKREWERLFPSKRIVALSTITVGAKYPSIVGLLILCEPRH